jgi:hypothetical protein
MGDKFKGFENLTSTVKKTTHNKLDMLKKKFDQINEQSMITTSVDTPVRKVTQHASKQADPYMVRVVYFLRDLTQV